MPLRGIIFDMGGTLLDYHPPTTGDSREGWKAMEATGADALRGFLQERGYTVPPPEEARRSNFAVMERSWRAVSTGQIKNIRLGGLLHEVLMNWGVLPEALANGLLDDAVAAYVAPAQSFVRPLEGTQEVLAALRERGLRMGLFSNTAWPGVFHLEDLSRWKLRDYLDCAFFSTDVGLWKPQVGSYALPLNALGLKPEEALYIGDHPYFDVYGAQQAGLRGVWLRGAEWPSLSQFEATIKPDAVLDRLSDLLPIVDDWMQ